MRGKALTFFLDNLSVKYSDYDPNTYRDLAFVPAIRDSERSLAKPFEVRLLLSAFYFLYLNDEPQLYAGPEWAALGFSVIDPSLPDGTASKLKLIRHPPTSELVTLLEKSPPEDEASARQWFEVLSGRGRLFHLFLSNGPSIIAWQSSHGPKYISCHIHPSYPSRPQERTRGSKDCNPFNATFLEREARNFIRNSSPSWILAHVPRGF